jgi:hypothetical protein
MQEYQRRIMVTGNGAANLRTLNVSRLRTAWVASITPWAPAEQSPLFTNAEEQKIPELRVRHVQLNDHDFLARVQLVAGLTQGIDFEYFDPLAWGASSANRRSQRKERSKECEGKAVVRFGDGTVANIEPFCEAVPDVETSDNRWLCLDCATFHFGGWSEPDTEQWVARHRRAIGFDREEESNAKAIAYLNR